jgi:hypothetical protein
MRRKCADCAQIETARGVGSRFGPVGKIRPGDREAPERIDLDRIHYHPKIEPVKPDRGFFHRRTRLLGWSAPWLAFEGWTEKMKTKNKYKND